MEDTQKQTEALPPETGNGEPDKEKTAFCNKFATADELERAYDNLQREFTRKCQQYSRLEKEMSRLKSADAKGEESAEPQTARPEGRDTETPTAANGAAAKTPAYESPDWESRVSGFFREYPSASTYAKEIAGELAKDRELATRDDCLERAYFRILRERDRPYEELASDDGFLEKYVYGNGKVRDRIIEEFLLKNMDVDAPRIIAGSGRTHVTPPSRPKSIRETGGIVKNMLANRRI